MNLRINDTAPDFSATTTHGPMSFHQWIGNQWCVLFSHPKDFTPVCTTELGYLAGMTSEFEQRNCRLIGLSVDSATAHEDWQKEIQNTQGHEVTYPLIADSDLVIAKLYGMLPADENGRAETRSASDNATVRTVFIIGPDKQIKLMVAYPMSTGRNFDEILRALDSLQLTAKYKVSTPVNWSRGDNVIIAPSISDEEAESLFPTGWQSVTSYLRYVPDPASR